MPVQQQRPPVASRQTAPASNDGDLKIAIDQLVDVLQQAEGARQNQHNENTARFDALQRQVEKLGKGFPGEDPEGHRRYHESVIEWRELRNKMVRDALLQAGKAGGLAALGWIAYAIWIAFRMEVTK